MKYILLIILCVSLIGCTAVPSVETEAAPVVASSEMLPSDAIDIYRQFFQTLYDTPLRDIMTPIFIDYKELTNAFVLSVALVELTGDHIPEVLVAYTSDVPSAPAQTYTQIYQLKKNRLEPWGTKLPMTMTFYGLNQLFGTAEAVAGQQLNRSYVQYQVIPEVQRTVEGTFSVVTSNPPPANQAALDSLITFARTMVVGSQSSDLWIMNQSDQTPPFLVFNQKAYPPSKLKGLAANFDLRFVNWKRLDQDFILNLERYVQSAGKAAVYEQQKSVDVDMIAQQIDSEMLGGQVKMFHVGDTRYFYVTELSVRGMEQFRIIKSETGDTQVYYRFHQPIKLVEGEKTYYPIDTDLQDRFLSLQQTMRSDVSRHLIYRFLLLDAFDKSVPYEGFLLEVNE